MFVNNMEGFENNIKSLAGEPDEFDLCVARLGLLEKKIFGDSRLTGKLRQAYGTNLPPFPEGETLLPKTNKILDEIESLRHTPVTRWGGEQTTYAEFCDAAPSPYCFDDNPLKNFMR
jgi:hypothetical protein